jgi:hypothetical protein
MLTRDHLNPIGRHTIDHQKGKPPKPVPPGAIQVLRPAVWRVLDLLDDVIQFHNEMPGGLRTSRSVPPPRLAHFLNRLIQNFKG